MNNEIPKYVTRARAAYLLGLPVEEIGRISEETGLGLRECAGEVEEIFYTYAELQRICVLATGHEAVMH
jgi:hypothetical protein